MDFWQRLKNIFSPEKVDLAAVVQEPLNPDFIDDKYIPEVVLDKNIGLYNYGLDKDKNVYRVLMCPLEKEIVV